MIEHVRKIYWKVVLEMIVYHSIFIHTINKILSKFFIVFFVSLISIPTKSLATSGNYLFSACTGEHFDAGRDLGSVHCVAYILGVLDATDVSPAVYAGFRNCRRPTVTVQQLRDSVVLYMKKNPQKRDSDAALIVLLAIAEVYPCRN